MRRIQNPRLQLLAPLLVASTLCGCVSWGDKQPEDPPWNTAPPVQQTVPQQPQPDQAAASQPASQIPPARRGAAASQPSEVRPVQFIQAVKQPINLPKQTEKQTERQRDEPRVTPSTGPTEQAGPTGRAFAEETYPIDLPTALRLAGANNLQIAFAVEQVQQAAARVDAADVLWVPSLNGGLIYNNHAGRIQATDGQVIEASRNSLFVGAGAVTASSPLAGGSGGPARMFVDMPLVDVFFEPLAARQVVQAALANRTATFNDTLLAAALGYLDLIQANASVVISEEAVKNAAELARLTSDFARSGQGLQADANRAEAELANREREVLSAKESAAVTSAALARILRLDSATRLVPADVRPIQLHFVQPGSDLRDLIGQAQSLRPEIVQRCAEVQETWYRTRQERWRPFVPHLYAGFSSGGFGGAPGSSVSSFSDRTDFDVAAIWQAQNLGLGNRARLREQNSLHRQAHLALGQVRDLIAMEVTQAYQRVHYRQQRIATTQSQVVAATKTLALNLEGIRGGVLRPIEIQQAIGALASARRDHLAAVIDHNQAQCALLRAIGRPVTEVP